MVADTTYQKNLYLCSGFRKQMIVELSKLKKKMKKLLVAFVAVVAVSFASCGGNTEATTCDSDSVCTDSQVVEEPVEADVDTVDTVATDTVVAE